MSRKKQIYYHFTSDKLRNGDPIPPVGVWLEHKGKLAMCVSGLHACAHPADALQYAPGPLLHQVELGGKIIQNGGKVVAKRRRILASFDATELLRADARQSALSVLHLWDAPTVVKEFLETGDESLRAAAGDAAWAAAGAAARAAARAAAWAAWKERLLRSVTEEFARLAEGGK